MKQLHVATHKTSIYAIWDLLKHDSKLGSKKEFNIRMYQCGSLRFLLFGMGGIGKNYWFGHNIISHRSTGGHHFYGDEMHLVRCMLGGRMLHVGYQVAQFFYKRVTGAVLPRTLPGGWYVARIIATAGIRDKWPGEVFVGLTPSRELGPQYLMAQGWVPRPVPPPESEVPVPEDAAPEPPLAYAA